MHYLVLVLLVIVACYIVFIVLPALTLMIGLTRRRTPLDFDTRPSVMDHTPYEPWKDILLEKMKDFRSRSYREVHISAADQTALAANWYPGGEKTAILFHGYNSTPINNFSAIATTFLDEGWSVLIPFMRGHSKSEGRTTLGLKEASDVILWANWVNDQVPCTDIIVYGISMGGAAIHFASADAWPEKVRVLVSESGYYSVERQMKGLKDMKWLPKSLLVPIMGAFARALLKIEIKTDGLARLRRTKVPMCFIAGLKDESVAPDIVETAWQACGAEKVFLKAENAPHTLAFLAGGEPLKTALFNFINKHMENGGKKE